MSPATTLTLRAGALALFAATAALLATPSAQAQDRITFKVVGQPAATGMVQKNKEKPFFDEFAKRTGLPIDADYKAIDQLGIKDTEAAARDEGRVVRHRVAARCRRTRATNPTLLGMDLVGASPDYETARKVYEAYFDTLDQRLQKQFQVKLLGVWPFGPQILFCKKPLTKLADLKGMKVRVYDQNLAKFIETVGGTPVPLSFTEVHQSLSMGVVDCAITGPQLGQLVQLARGDHAPVPAGLPDGAQRLCDHAQRLEEAQARPAGQDAGRLQDADRRDLGLLEGADAGRAELQRPAATPAPPARSSSWSTCR